LKQNNKKPATENQQKNPRSCRRAAEKTLGREEWEASGWKWERGGRRLYQRKTMKPLKWQKKQCI